MEMSNREQWTSSPPLVARPPPLYGAAMSSFSRQSMPSPSSLADLVDRNNCICLRQSDLDEAGDESSMCSPGLGASRPASSCG
jgi:hypothetical protein